MDNNTALVIIVVVIIVAVLINTWIKSKKPVDKPTTND